jgi:ABC-type Fe3+/spermidine/putrescine transport system ATPase subunit
VEQIGTPEDLYERPATRFVASFIGETNFFHGRVVTATGDSCQVAIQGFQTGAANGGAVTEGEAVVVAVRPERIVLASDGPGLPVELTDIIYIGNARKYVVRLSDGRECFVLRHADAEDVLKIGDKARLSWNARHAIGFSA